MTTRNLKRRIKRKMRHSPWRFLLFLAISLWFLGQGLVTLWDIIQLRAKKIELEDEILRLKVRKALLHRKQEFLESEEGIKVLAEKKLGMKEVKEDADREQ